jgi:hypothetical protein
MSNEPAIENTGLAAENCNAFNRCLSTGGRSRGSQRHHRTRWSVPSCGAGWRATPSLGSRESGRSTTDAKSLTRLSAVAPTDPRTSRPRRSTVPVASPTHFAHIARTELATGVQVEATVIEDAEPALGGRTNACFCASVSGVLSRTIATRPASDLPMNLDNGVVHDSGNRLSAMSGFVSRRRR